LGQPDRSRGGRGADPPPGVARRRQSEGALRRGLRAVLPARQKVYLSKRLSDHGIPACWRAASGHAAALPSPSATNPRRLKAARLKAQVAQRWVIVGTATEGPVIFALAILDRQVVDAGDTSPHQAVVVELPVLVAVAAKPVAGIVVPFICKAHGDPVVAERPHFLNQPIIELAIPFAREKRLDLRAALHELGAVAPDAVDSIAEGDAGGIAGVPGIFGEARLLRGGLGRERRQRWAGHRLTPACSSSTCACNRSHEWPVVHHGKIGGRWHCGRCNGMIGYPPGAAGGHPETLPPQILA